MRGREHHEDSVLGDIWRSLKLGRSWVRSEVKDGVGRSLQRRGRALGVTSWSVESCRAVD